VTEHHSAAREALGSGRREVVLTNHFQEARPGVADEWAGQVQTQDRCGQDEVAEVVAEAGRGAGGEHA
jgi:hypothetical protein